MGVTVERLYRITVGGKRLTLDGDETLSQAESLITALGIAPGEAVSQAEHLGEGAIHPPAQLQSGPVATAAEGKPARDIVKGAERDRIIAEERERGDGWAERAAERCGISASAIYLHTKKAAAIAQSAVAAPAPPAAQNQQPPDDWTDAQSRYLIELMTRPNASMQYATTRCGHSFVATTKRWSALKVDGIASVEEWDRRHGTAAAEAAG